MEQYLSQISKEAKSTTLSYFILSAIFIAIIVLQVVKSVHFYRELKRVSSSTKNTVRKKKIDSKKNKRQLIIWLSGAILVLSIWIVMTASEHIRLSKLYLDIEQKSIVEYNGIVDIAEETQYEMVRTGKLFPIRDKKEYYVLTIFYNEREVEFKLPKDSKESQQYGLFEGKQKMTIIFALHSEILLNVISSE